MSSCEKSSHKDFTRRRGSGCGPVATAFFVYGVGNLLFISFIAIDNKLKRDNRDGQLNKIYETLENIKSDLKFQSCEEGGYCHINEEITRIKRKLQKCARKRSLIGVIRDQARNREDYVDMWDSVPKPFIHLEMDRADASRVNETLKGWKRLRKDDDRCGHIDPMAMPDGVWVEIKMTGYYYLCSHVTFKCTGHIDESAQVHRHLTEVFGNEHNNDPIMINTYQLCGKGDAESIKASYQAGIFHLKSGERISVRVLKPQTTSLHVDRNQQHNDDVFFSAYMV